MNVKRLVVEGRDGDVVALACGMCGTVYLPRDTERADQCCAPYNCSDCGTETKRYWLKCDDCRAKAAAQKERERFDAAVKIPASKYDGEQVYDPHRDAYEVDASDAFEDAEPPAPYVYATTYRALHIDAEGVVENAAEGGEHHDELADSIPQHMMDELQAFLDGWCKRTGEGSYFPDYSRAIVPDPATEEAA